MKIKIALAFVWFLCYNSLSGQEIDSLINVVKSQKDTTRVNSLLLLGKALRQISKDSSIATFDEAITYAKSIKFYSGQIKGLRFRGITFGMNHEYTDAILNFNEAVALGIKYNHPQETADAYNGLGVVYKRMGEYVNSLKNYHHSLTIYKKNKLKVGEAVTCTNLGILYDLMGEYEDSYKYYNAAYKIDDSLGNIKSKNLLLSNISIYHTRKKEYQKAISILQEVFKYYIKTNSKDNLIPVYNNISHNYKLLKAYDSTIYYADKAIEFTKNNSISAFDASSAYLNRAEAYFLKGNFTKAIADSKNNFELSKALGFSKRLESYQLKARIYDSLGNYKESMAAYKMVIALKDSLFDENKVKQYKSEEIKQQVYYKNEQIANQKNNIQILNRDVKQGKIWNLFLVTIVGLFIVSMVLLYQKYSFRNKTNLLLRSQNELIGQQKKEIELINEELENRMLRAQINPHFIFNALNSIQHFITINDKISTLKYLTKFSSLLRQILENSISSKVSVEDEIKFLKIYIDLEALRFDDSFSYEIKIDESIDLYNAEVPILFLQPFVENAILHGLLPKVGEKHLKISIGLEGGSLIFEIEDNGIGKQAAQILKDKKKIEYKSRGLSVTEQRIKMLQKEDDKGSVSYIDLKSDDGLVTGTKVIIKVPINN